MVETSVWPPALSADTKELATLLTPMAKILVLAFLAVIWETVSSRRWSQRTAFCSIELRAALTRSRVFSAEIALPVTAEWTMDAGWRASSFSARSPMTLLMSASL